MFQSNNNLIYSQSGDVVVVVIVMCRAGWPVSLSIGHCAILVRTECNSHGSRKTVCVLLLCGRGVPEMVFGEEKFIDYMT